MKKLLTVFAVVFGLSYSLAGNAETLSEDEAKEVLLNGETIASGTSLSAVVEKFGVLAKYKGQLYKCFVTSLPERNLTATYCDPV